MKKKEVAIRRLRECLAYDPDTGIFVWLNGQRKGKIAGTLSKGGYVVICIDQVTYLAHRLAMATSYGEWPKDSVDHANGVRNDNRLTNLRCATHQENLCNHKRRTNNKSGVKGVHWSSTRGKWVAQITTNYKMKTLGYFDTVPQAATAYKAAALKLHGTFARTA